MNAYKKEVLLEDERGRGFGAVVRAGPYLFIAGSDGHRSAVTERVDPAATWQPETQTRNSYDRIVRRLERCGFHSRCVVWLEHFVSSQEWMQLRLALWRDYFGMSGTAGGGAQAFMSGINMVTTAALGVTPETAHLVIDPPPNTPFPANWSDRAGWVHRAYQPSFNLEDLRCSRAVRAADFVFTVGVRGSSHPATGALAPVETPAAFPTQARNCFEEYRAFLAKAALNLRDLVRVDAHIRDVNRAREYWEICTELFGGPPPFATSPVGMPIGGSGEMDMCAIAVAPGVAKELAWHPEDPTRVQAVKAAGLVFASGCNGMRSVFSRDQGAGSGSDPAAQTLQAFKCLEAAVGRFGVGLESIVRLDVVLRDIYFEAEFLRIMRSMCGTLGPAVTICGGTPSAAAAVELAAIAVY